MKAWLENEKGMEMLDKVLNWCGKTAGNIVIAAIFLLVTFRVLNSFMKLLKKSFSRSNMEETVAGFLVSLIQTIIRAVLILTAASIVGFEITSFLTVLGSAGVAIGLALQGSLSNFAGGVLILILKPFQVGDYIVEDNKNNEGTVIAIDIFYTKLLTIDNKTVVIPNGILSNTSLTNVTKQDKRRLDLRFGIDYSEDIKRVKDVLLEIMKQEERILPGEEIKIYVEELGDSAIQIGVRVWITMEDYWDVKWALLEKVKCRFDEEKITIPYNHLNVTVTSEEK